MCFGISVFKRFFFDNTSFIVDLMERATRQSKSMKICALKVPQYILYVLSRWPAIGVALAFSGTQASGVVLFFAVR